MITPKEITLQSIKDGYGGDTYRRKFTGDVAQCGCFWHREPKIGDILTLCPIHKAASEARWKMYERKLPTSRKTM